MQRLTRGILALVLAGLILVLSVSVPGPATAASASLEKQFAFRNAMRKLWEDHITWTRLYIISVAADLEDKDATAQRLLRNQADIGRAITPFYGKAAGEKLTALLREHILGAAALLEAAKAGDTAKVNEAQQAMVCQC